MDDALCFLTLFTAREEKFLENLKTTISSKSNKTPTLISGQSSRMAKLLSRSHLVSYLPGLKALQHRATLALSSKANFSCSSAESGHAPEDIQYSTSAISDADLGPLGPTNPLFPLPGNTGVASQVNVHMNSVVQTAMVKAPDILTRPLPQDRHAGILAQFVNTVSEETQHVKDNLEDGDRFKNHPQALECIAQDCPENLRKEFLNLFPGVKLKSSDAFTVVTLCQRTRNNMTGWSSEVEEERNELTENFFESAKQMCRVLSEAGYWADFIDPTSGQAFLGDPNPNTTLFETDERYRSLGFDIEDLGCCKCIRHSEWGTHAFIGTIFTNAPPNCRLITSILRESG